MTSAQRTIAEVVAALVVLVGGYTLWRNEVRAAAIVAFQTKAADSTAKIERDSIAIRATIAQDAAQHAQAQKVAALKQVAVSEGLRRIADSVAKTSSAERDSARRLLADSIASVGQYRAEVARLVEAGVRDSAASRASHQADEDSIRSLLATVVADSSALTAEQRRSQSLQALNETLTREVGLLKKAQPSTFGNVVRVVGWAGAGFALGHVLK